MKPRTYDFGLIPCTSGKRPDGLTPLTLYKGGPFSLMMRHAQQRCGEILIMSAKYGLLGLQDPVRYYDAYLPDLTEAERAALAWRIKSSEKLLGASAPGTRILSYLPRAYHEFLAGAKPEIVGALKRPYANLPSLSLYAVLSHEIKNYGTHPARR